jgi:hypothetical protein
MAVLVAGILGGMIGGAVVGCALHWLGPREWSIRPLGRREADRLSSLSYQLWHLYVALVSGPPVPLDKLRVLYDEVLLVTSDLECEKESEGALLAMRSLLHRAWTRAAEFRRVGLSVYPAQFADLTDDMQAAFVCVQLASGRMRSRAEKRTWGHAADLGAARIRRLAQPRS